MDLANGGGATGPLPLDARRTFRPVVEYEAGRPAMIANGPREEPSRTPRFGGGRILPPRLRAMSRPLCGRARPDSPVADDRRLLRFGTRTRESRPLVRPDSDGPAIVGLSRVGPPCLTNQDTSTGALERTRRSAGKSDPIVADVTAL